MTRPGVDRQAFETPRLLHCHFCLWALHVTDVDRQGDVADAYSTHLVRHGEAAAVAAVEQCVWDDVVARLDP